VESVTLKMKQDANPQQFFSSAQMPFSSSEIIKEEASCTTCVDVPSSNDKENVVCRKPSRSMLQHYEMLVPGINIENPPVHVQEMRGVVEIQIVDFDRVDLSIIEATNDTLERMLELERPSHSGVRWINVQGIDWTVIKTLAKEFNLHPLAVEDILYEQRVKLDFYDNHIFISMHLMELHLNTDDSEKDIIDPDGCLFSDHQMLLGLSKLENYPRPNCLLEHCSFLMLNDNIVISIWEKEGQDIAQIMKERLLIPSNISLLRRHADPSFLLYSLMDLVVDKYHSVLEFYSTQLNGIEKEVLLSPKISITRTLHLISKEVQILKRFLASAERIFLHLMDAENYISLTSSNSVNHYQISKMTKIYLNDINDQLKTLLDHMLAYESACKGMVELTFNQVSHSTNESMKALAVASLFFLPLTFLCGVFGMNFDYFPELHFDFGFLYFWALALTSICITMGYSYNMGFLSSRHC
jgi:Mg2+ and Co2+ transporter CorA